MTKRLLQSLLCASAASFWLPATAPAQENNALLRALVNKGILSDEEAENIRGDLAKEAAPHDAEKIALTKTVDELKIFGDARLRFEYDNVDQQAANTGNNQQRVRWRFRLRLNAAYDFSGPFFGGVSLETGQAANSANQTFQDGYRDYNIFISKIYLGWNVTDWMTVVAGKQKNPFYTTNLVWDADINPQGITESIQIHKLFSSSETVAGVFGKDGKTMLPGETKLVEPRWQATLNAGQFIYDDNNEYLFDNDNSTDAYMFVTQLVLGYKVSDTVSVTVAPGWLVYNAATLTGVDVFNDNNIAGNAQNGATRDLSLLLLPGEVSFPLFGLSARFFWDFAYNTSGDSRVDDLYGGGGNLSTQDRIAFLAGIELGKVKKAGSWAVYADYRQTGVEALDPNLTDSDFNNGQLNAAGFEFGVEYAVTDFIKAGVEYDYAWNLNNDLINPVSGGNNSSLLQVDLNWAF